MPVGDNLTFFIIGAVFVLLIVALGWLIRIELRFKKMFRGRGVSDLESALSNFTKDLDDIQKWAEKTHDSVEDLRAELKKSARHIGIVRFNPYNDVGGDQSFSISVLDDNKNGIVLSGIYGRDYNRVFAKPVMGGGSKYQLSSEEKEAILKAFETNNPDLK